MKNLKKDQLRVIKVFLDFSVSNPFFHLIRRQYFKRPNHEIQFIKWMVGQIKANNPDQVDQLFYKDIKHIFQIGKAERFRPEIELIIQIGSQLQLNWVIPKIEEIIHLEEEKEKEEVVVKEEATLEITEEAATVGVENENIASVENKVNSTAEKSTVEEEINNCVICVNNCVIQQKKDVTRQEITEISAESVEPKTEELLNKRLENVESVLLNLIYTMKVLQTSSSKCSCND